LKHLAGALSKRYFASRLQGFDSKGAAKKAIGTALAISGT